MTLEQAKASLRIERKHMRLACQSIAQKMMKIQRLQDAVRYLAHECDPKRNGFFTKFPELKEMVTAFNRQPPQIFSNPDIGT